MNGASNAATTANTTQFYHISAYSVPDTEVRAKMAMRTSGRFHNFFLRLTASSTNGTSTYRFRKNAANGQQAISTGAATTGAFEDIVNSDAIVPGDLVNSSSVPSSTGTMTASIIAYLYDDQSLPVTKLGAVLVLISNVQHFEVLEGFVNNATGTEANAKTRQRKSGVYQNLYTNVTTHGANTATFISRKNGADGNLTTSYGSNATGIVEDLTHSDSVVVGDDYCWSVTETTSVNLTAQIIGAEFIPNANENFVQFCIGRTDGFSGTASANDFFPLDGHPVAGTSTEANYQYIIRQPATFSELTVFVQSAPTNTATLNFRRNGANTAMAISITNATTGVLSASTTVAPVQPGDSLCHELVNGASTTAKLSYICVWASFGPVNVAQHFGRSRTLYPSLIGAPVLMG